MVLRVSPAVTAAAAAAALWCVAPARRRHPAAAHRRTGSIPAAAEDANAVRFNPGRCNEALLAAAAIVEGGSSGPAGTTAVAAAVDEAKRTTEMASPDPSLLLFLLVLLPLAPLPQPLPLLLPGRCSSSSRCSRGRRLRLLPRQWLPRLAHLPSAPQEQRLLPSIPDTGGVDTEVEHR